MSTSQHLRDDFLIQTFEDNFDRRKRDVEIITSLCSQEVSRNRRAEIDQ